MHSFFRHAASWRSRLSAGGKPAAAVLAFSAALFSPSAIINAFAQSPASEATSIPYGSDQRQTLDVYRPAGNVKNAPVVVFFYGGSWQFGTKERYQFIGSSLARRGFLVVIPDYRLYPQVNYPGFVEDGARAVRWTKANAARFGGNPNKLFVMGHSAGAYIAAMLAIDNRWLAAVGMSKRNLSGLIGVSGPYDFLPLKDRKLIAMFGGANRPETQPINYVSGGEPPALLQTGRVDTVVDPDNATRLAARLRAKGSRAEVQKYSAVGHITIVGAYAPPFTFLAPVLNDATAFINGIAGDARAARELETAQ